MTVGSETSTAEFGWSGVETAFPAAALSAETPDDIVAVFVAEGGSEEVTLIRGVHYQISLAPLTGLVTATPAAMPPPPGTLVLRRQTPAVQETRFADLDAFPARALQTLFDRAFRIFAELRRDVVRIAGPWTLVGGVVDFGEFRLRGADPVDDADLATKAHVAAVTGSVASGDFVAAAEAAAEEAQVAALASIESQGLAASAAASAAGHAGAAQAAALALQNPDYGFYTDAPTETRDYGSYAA